MKPATPPFAPAERACEIAPAPARRVADWAEAHHDNSQDDGNFQQRKHELEFARLFYAEVVEERDQNGGGDGKYLSPVHGERRGEDVGGEKSEDGKRTQNSHQPRDHRRNRSRLGNDKPRPRVEKRGQRSVSVADIDVFAAGLRLHRPELGISERAEKRQYPAHHPRQIYQLGRAHGLHHLGRDKKNSAADDGPDNHRRGVTDF